MLKICDKCDRMASWDSYFKAYMCRQCGNKMTDTYSIDYDERFDVFYYRRKNRQDSYGDENNCGIVTLREFAGESVVGMIIYGFKERALTGELQETPLPLSLDWENPGIQQIINGGQPCR